MKLLLGHKNITSYQNLKLLKRLKINYDLVTTLQIYGDNGK